jgi:phosphatidylinositol-bisphosphatase
MDQVDKRNQDFASITKRLFFPVQSKKQKSTIDYVSYYWNDGGDEGVSSIERQGIVKDWTKEASVFHSE